jgi:hypothetical protein
LALLLDDPGSCGNSPDFYVFFDGWTPVGNKRHSGIYPNFWRFLSMSISDNLTGSPQKWGSFAGLASPWASRTGTACSCFTYPARQRGKSPVAMEVLRENH